MIRTEHSSHVIFVSLFTQMHQEDILQQALQNSGVPGTSGKSDTTADHKSGGTLSMMNVRDTATGTIKRHYVRKVGHGISKQNVEKGHSLRHFIFKQRIVVKQASKNLHCSLFQVKEILECDMTCF